MDLRVRLPAGRIGLSIDSPRCIWPGFGPHFFFLCRISSFSRVFGHLCDQKWVTMGSGCDQESIRMWSGVGQDAVRNSRLWVVCAPVGSRVGELRSREHEAVGCLFVCPIFLLPVFRSTVFLPSSLALHLPSPSGRGQGEDFVPLLYTIVIVCQLPVLFLVSPSLQLLAPQHLRGLELFSAARHETPPPKPIRRRKSLQAKELEKSACDRGFAGPTRCA